MNIIKKYLKNIVKANLVFSKKFRIGTGKQNRRCAHLTNVITFGTLYFASVEFQNEFFFFEL